MTLSTTSQRSTLQGGVLAIPGTPNLALPAQQERAHDHVDEVAKALRGARARTGMTEHQVVAVLAEQGFAITVARLRAWERTGVIRVDAAARLADAYGTTIDALAGRRVYRSRHTPGP